MPHAIGPWEGLAYYTNSIATLWAEKICISTLITGFVGVFGGDAVLLWFLGAVWVADFALGLLDALQRGHFRCRALARGVLKAPAYCLYLLLVGVVNVSLARSTGMDMPLLNLFVAYLIITDVVSIMAHLQRMGIPVPVLLQRIVIRSRVKIEKKVSTALDDTEQEKEI